MKQTEKRKGDIERGIEKERKERKWMIWSILLDCQSF